jgi:hypothetical protein
VQNEPKTNQLGVPKWRLKPRKVTFPRLLHGLAGNSAGGARWASSLTEEGKREKL